jgi:hypothetical protein
MFAPEWARAQLLSWSGIGLNAARPGALFFSMPELFA